MIYYKILKIWHKELLKNKLKIFILDRFLFKKNACRNDQKK